MKKQLNKIKRKINKLQKSIKPVTDEIVDLERKYEDLSDEYSLAKNIEKYQEKYFEINEWNNQKTYVFIEKLDDNCHVTVSGFTFNLHGYKQNAFYNSDEFFFRNVLDENAKIIELTKAEFMAKYQEFKASLLKIELKHG